MTLSASGPARRWLFGDQLGPHFLDDESDSVVMIESSRVLRRRVFHRQKAHLVLSAMRHRAAELGERVTYVRSLTYREGLAEVDGPLDVVQPTSFAAVRLVAELSGEREILRHPARGFASSRAEFVGRASRRGRQPLGMEDFYRENRTRLGVLVEDGTPVGGRWTFDTADRQPPRRPGRVGLPEPCRPEEDDIDAEVRDDLDRMAADGVRFLGDDGPRRFAATRTEALAALADFVEHRLPDFGRDPDGMRRDNTWSDDSLLSAPMNVGLLHPLEVVRAAEAAYRSGSVPIAATEGFVRQVIGWRDYLWHLYWFLGEDYRWRNELRAVRFLPDWMEDLDPGGTDAACLQHTLRSVREDGWTHHAARRVVLGNYALQQGWDPAGLTSWFHRSLVDGYDWSVVPNVVGLSQYADGGLMAPEPYLAGGEVIDAMSDYCGTCVFDPAVRVGENACPFTAGYWRFLYQHRERFAGNRRMLPLLRSMDRLPDLDRLLAEHDE